jgi:hypothetical protein
MTRTRSEIAFAGWLFLALPSACAVSGDQNDAPGRGSGGSGASVGGNLGSGGQGASGAGGVLGSAGSVGSDSGGSAAGGSGGSGGSATGGSGGSGIGGGAGLGGGAGAGGAGMGGIAGSAGASATGGSAGSAGTSGSGGAAGSAGTSGSGGAAGSAGTSGSGGSGGLAGTSGSGGAAGSAGSAGTSGSGGGTGTCCPDGNCLCHGPNPTGLTDRDGPFDTDTFRISVGTVHYPTDADPPFAGVAICAGFLNTGPEMADWGSFYASHGIVTVVTTTTGADLPAVRARKLLDAVEALKGENTRSGSPLMGKMSDRYGTSGYSMGGGGTTIASGDAPTNKTSVGLATFGGSGTRVQVPTLLLCGTSDSTAPCSMSQSVYRSIPDSTPKMMITISGGSHLTGWFSPTANSGVSGGAALAFQKVFLEGDQRWKPFLLQSRGDVTTNIQ